MHSHVRSSVIAGVAVAGIGTLAVAPLAPPSPEINSPPTAVHEVRLAAAPAPPPLGAVPLAFIRNQFDYCSVICPDVVRLAITVPAGAVLSPAAFLGSLQATGSLTRAIGAAAGSVTGPANAATTPIIRNDLNIVLPKAQRALQVALVQGIRIGETSVQVGDVLGAVQTARIEILDALNQPKGPPTKPTGAQGVFEVTAAEAVNVFSAVVFQAGELLLLGVVQAADDAAQELARSGDPGAALAAGAAKVNAIVNEADGIVVDTVETAAANIRDSFDDPIPSSAQTPTVTSNVAARQDEPKQAKADTDTARRADGTGKPADAHNESLKKVVDNPRRVVDSSTKRALNTLDDKETEETQRDRSSGDDGDTDKKPDRRTSNEDAS